MLENATLISDGLWRRQFQKRLVHVLPLAVVGVMVAVIGCASNQEAFEAPPETRPPVETSAPPEVVSEESQPEDGKDDLTVVIDAGESAESARKTLLEAAAAERERRRRAGPADIVITNENLADHATGELTVVSSGAARQVTPADPGEASAEDAARGELYWRGRVLQVRQDWRTTLEEIEHLESRVAELRRSFYSEDDPYYRDTQIKPSWDRTLERLTEARAAADGFRAQVDEILEEGRQAGAFPGWLREGIELEPDGREDEDGSRRLEEHEPQEPTVVENDGQTDPP
jgi:hypothetical protein